MITKIDIQNFRSLSQISPELGKITVLTGANNSGKSSILYGLMILQDFLRNYFSFLKDHFPKPFINLGKFSDVKSKNSHTVDPDFMHLGIFISTETSTGPQEVFYGLAISEGRTFITFRSIESRFEFYRYLNTDLPEAEPTSWVRVKPHGQEDAIEVRFNWNGIQSTIGPEPQLSDATREDIKKVLNSPFSEIPAIDFAPISRGFTKPSYNPVPERGIIQTEDEIATLLKSEEETLKQVNNYLKQIAGREIELVHNGASDSFSLLARNTQTGQTNFLVNEGSGTNQVVTLLAKIFQPRKQFICIDEPEIHLHPSMVRNLAGAFTEMATGAGGKQFLVSTHSEHFVQALLEKVASGKIPPHDVKVYHLSMTDAGTAIEHQKINEKGQLEGGLSHFYAEEFEGLKTLFKLVD